MIRAPVLPKRTTSQKKTHADASHNNKQQPSPLKQKKTSHKIKNSMGIAFDSAPGRPEHIDTILNGLDRYNPETTAVFQDYVTQQCEDRTYDCYANLALLKL